MSSAPALHPIERSILRALANKDSNADSLAASTGLSIDQVRRGIEWLRFKNLISVSESSTLKVHLASEGVSAAANGLPERRLVNAVKAGKTSVDEILSSGAIKNEEVNAAIAGARRNKWIQLVEGRMTATALTEKQSAEETFLANLKAGTEVAKMTEAENRLWIALCAASFPPMEFHPQYTVGNYTVDFCAPDEKLIIEVDDPEALEHDEFYVIRNAWFKAEGWRLLRFTSHDALKNTAAVLSVISAVLRKSSGTGEELHALDYQTYAYLQLAVVASKEGDFAEAARIWDRYRERFPRGQRAAEATYWYGESAPHAFLQYEGPADFLTAEASTPRVLMRATSSSDQRRKFFGG